MQRVSWALLDRAPTDTLRYLVRNEVGVCRSLRMVTQPTRGWRACSRGPWQPKTRVNDGQGEMANRPELAQGCVPVCTICAQATNGGGQE